MTELNETKKISQMKSVKQLLEKWQDNLYLEGNGHSIFNQICRMLWNHAWFRTLNQCVMIANGKKRFINSGLWQFITISYVETQTLAIRKLIDKDKDVISLERLLDEFSVRAREVTREAFLYSHGSKVTSDNEEYWHQQFDELSGISPSLRRKPSDTIRSDVFKKMGRLLCDNCDHIKLHVNKLVAHSANEKSIANFKSKVSFKVIENAQRIICQIYSFLSTNLYGRTVAGLIPVPQYPLFKGLENAFMLEEDCKEIGQFWNEHNEKTNQWTDYKGLLKTLAENKPRKKKQ